MRVKHTKIGLNKNKMNLLFALLLNISLTFTGVNCSKDDRSNDPLPESRPGQLVIEWRESGGMEYYSEALYLSEDSSYYTVNDAGAISRVNFKISPQDFDNLYKVFTDNDFDRIKTYDEKVYDRGGTSIYVRWEKGKYASVSNSGMSFIKESWRKEWSACENALEDIIKKESDKNRKDYGIRFDKTMFGKEINVYIQNIAAVPKSILLAEREDDEYISRIVKLIPGKHRLAITFDKKFNSFYIDSDSSKGIIFSLKNDSLAYNFITP